MRNVDKRVFIAGLSALPMLVLSACSSETSSEAQPTPTPVTTQSSTETSAATTTTATTQPIASTPTETTELRQVDADTFLNPDTDGYRLTFNNGTTCTVWNGASGAMIDCPFAFDESVLVPAEIPSMATHAGGMAVANVIRYDAQEGFVPRALYTEGQVPPGARLHPGEQVTILGFTFEHPDASTFTGSRDGHSFAVADGVFTAG